ncbi:MAG: YbaK/EbsC family protein [Patescibacteria group bacterium]|jgi:Ala-tRNA(Pro) deacylase
MINQKVLNYLNKQKVGFTVIDHKKIFTAYDLAQTLKMDLKKVAKTLLVQADKKFVIVIVPAHYRLDFKKLKKVLKAKQIKIPSEKIMEKVLKVKVGGITPFGALHGLETVVDKSLLKTQETILNAGSFTQSLRLKVKDFLKMEEARLGSFVESAGYKKPKVNKPKKVKAKKAKKIKKVNRVNKKKK